jgi:hypothetical protein
MQGGISLCGTRVSKPMKPSKPFIVDLSDWRLLYLDDSIRVVVLIEYVPALL